jgi:hypothetical protein
MIVNVFGSTKNEIHFGCKSLSAGLDTLIEEICGADTVVNHFMHNYISPGFLDVFKVEKSQGKIIKSKLSRIKKGKSFKGLDRFESKRDYDQWQLAVKLVLKDRFIRRSIKVADVNVVNVEGSIHDERLYGWYLLALAQAIKELGGKLVWANVTMQNENKKVLDKVLKSGELIPCREQFTTKYLKENSYNAVQSFDTAVLAPFAPSSAEKFDKKVLVTGSVNKVVEIVSIFEEVRKRGFEPVYLPAGLSDVEVRKGKGDIQIAEELGVEICGFNEVPFLQLPRYISGFEFVISGRHHLNILSAVAGTPFIPLASNSWKIEGIVNFFEIHGVFNKPLSESIDYVLGHHDQLADLLKSKLPEAKELARLNFVID